MKVLVGMVDDPVAGELILAELVRIAAVVAAVCSCIGTYGLV